MINGVSTSSPSPHDLAALRKQRFQKADADGDGKLTKEEFRAAMPKRADDSRVEGIFKRIDTNQDGSIDSTEDQAALDRLRKHHGSHEHSGESGGFDASRVVRSLFKAADGDQDGKITKSELTAVLGSEASKAEKLVDRFFKATDADEDGSVTQAEFEDTLKQLIERLRAPASSTSTPPAAPHYDSAGNTKTDSSTTQFVAMA